MNRRIPHSLGSAVMLAGAFSVGWVLHQVLVRGTLSATAPASVTGLAAGIALIAAGRAMERRFDPSALVPGPESNKEGEETFDETLSPVDREDLESYERDEARE